MSTRSIYALLGIVILGLGCGRVIKLPSPGGSSQPSADDAGLTMQLPAAAMCLPQASTFAASSDSQAPAYSTCPVWTNARPAGACYEADEAWPGLRDHVAYLTFDDGPIDWTPAILDTLKEAKVRATFFVNARGTKGPAGLDGSFVNEQGETIYYRDVLKRTVDEGHALGNHTRDHSDLGKLTRSEIDEQFAQNERLVNEALVRSGGEARPLTLLRAPFGSPWFSETLDDPDASEALVGSASMRFGYNVLWNVTSTDALEWAQGEAPTHRTLQNGNVTRDPNLSYEQKLTRIRSAIFDHPLVKRGAGIVILMHDTHNSTRDLLPEIIAGLRERGYSFDDLENQVREQFGRGSVELTPGPALTAACTADESARSCAKVSSSEVEVCGRFWLAFEALGGVAKLGLPLHTPEQDDVVFQRFERGHIELHPEWRAPCDVIFVPNE